MQRGMHGHIRVSKDMQGYVRLCIYIQSVLRRGYIHMYIYIYTYRQICGHVGPYKVCAS